MADLRRFRTLARNWEAFAQADPLFGVLSDPTKVRGQWDLDEFFGSGVAHVRKLLRILDELHVPFVHGRCLDFGCGVGRLTVPLAAHFSSTTGVDVSKSMIETARKYRPRDARVEFVHNGHPDCRQFADRSFDLVHTCLVLQHIPPEVTLRYIAEFFRVAAPGGVVIFQLPAATITEEALTSRYALPDAGVHASLDIAGLPSMLRMNEPLTVTVTVTNTSREIWRDDIPAGRHICIANHWLDGAGQVIVSDDGRARLPETVWPGGSVSVPLLVHAPPHVGEVQLEVDLVQEHVCWFAQKGSPTARVASIVRPEIVKPQIANTSWVKRSRPNLLPRPTLWQRLRRRVIRATPSFEMHVIPRAEVERVVTESGGVVLHAVDDNAAGDRWLSYTYVCRKQSRVSSSPES